MPATTTTATQRKALEQRQAETRKALADRRKFLHRMRNKVHQYTGIDMRDQELVRLERENRDVKQALDALYHQEGQASAATKSKVATKRRKRTRGRRRGRSSGSKTTSSRKQLVLGLVLAVAGALAVVKRETIREKWEAWLNQQQQGSETSTKGHSPRAYSSRLRLHTPSNPNIQPVDIGIGRQGRPKYKRTAVIVLSALDTGNPWVILARKCFGPNKPTHPLGERDQVGHRLYNNPTLKQHNQGAAGTKEKYWGTWGTFGGGNDTHAKSNLHAGKLEVIEEAALGAEGTQIVNGFIFHHSFVISRTMCYVAECRDTSQFTYLDKKDPQSKRELIFSSKGEIAELRKVRLLDIRTFDRESRDIHGGKGVASYALNSITEHVIPWYEKYSRTS